jgi:5-methylcytosine-specific restriction enzyme subunit McrC
MILELTEYQPKMLPAAGLSEETGKFLFENFKDQIEVEPPSFLNDRHWKITSQGYVFHSSWER